MQAVLRACAHAFAASDALGGAGNFPGGKGYRACAFTGSAGDAPFLLPVNLHKAEPVEPAINRAQRAQILEEGLVYFYGKNQNKDQNSQLPEKQPSRLAAQHFIGSEERDCAK